MFLHVHASNIMHPYVQVGETTLYTLHFIFSDEYDILDQLI